MKNKLEVSFNSPQCGWMSIGFSDGRNEFHTTTAHAPHRSALPELLRILCNLLDAETTADEYVLRWNRNPEEFDFRFVRMNEEILLEIYQFPSEARLEPERELVYSFRGGLHDVCAAFYETFAQLHEDRDTDEFEFNWHQPFPFAEFENFKSKIETVRI